MKKDIQVSTNDPANPTQTLILTGQIDKLFSLSPRRLRLVGTLGTEIKQKLVLDTHEKYPFKLTAVRAQHGTHIRYKFEEVAQPQKMRYVVTVENTREETGSFLDKLYLVTDSQLQPEIEVPIYGLINPKPDNRQE